MYKASELNGLEFDLGELNQNNRFRDKAKQKIAHTYLPSSFSTTCVAQLSTMYVYCPAK